MSTIISKKMTSKIIGFQLCKSKEGEREVLTTFNVNYKLAIGEENHWLKLAIAPSIADSKIKKIILDVGTSSLLIRLYDNQHDPIVGKIRVDKFQEILDFVNDAVVDAQLEILALENEPAKQLKKSNYFYLEITPMVRLYDDWETYGDPIIVSFTDKDSLVKYIRQAPNCLIISSVTADYARTNYPGQF